MHFCAHFKYDSLNIYWIEKHIELSLKEKLNAFYVIYTFSIGLIFFGGGEEY